MWLPPPEKADLLVLFAHPDDEVLFMGGVLPYYAGELHKRVMAACVVPASSQRSLELLDSLWLNGLRSYPSFGPMRDNFSMSLQGMYGKWRKDKLYRYVVGLYRRFKPDVVVSHDMKGEYGHGAHRAAADAAWQSLTLSANAKRYPDSAKEYGVWDVPKLYLHLYEKNAVDMNWRRPLDAFGGKTAFDMAKEGYACHTSQQQTEYTVEDSGPYDNSLFGLVHTNVGPDVKKDDFFENIRGEKP
jgi:LmbE family N-acetylglucosaminyl deacetylase